MRALVVFESMYGNTHTIADAIAAGLGDAPEMDEVQVVHVGQADAAAVTAADLVVVGGPTHGHSMSRESTRTQAVSEAEKPDKHLELDPEADPGAGVREWLAGIGSGDGTASAAFDTRVDWAAVLSGRASKAIAKALHHHDFTEVVKPESFLVTTENELVEGEAERAREWGRSLAAHVQVSSRP
jgi:hypothetical protein